MRATKPRAKNKVKCESCDKPARCRGLCNSHYKAYLTSRRGQCEVDGCDRGIEGRNLCGMHYQRLMKTGEVGEAGTVRITNEGVKCPGPECGQPAFSRGYCSAHYQMLIQGKPLRPVNRRISATMGMSTADKISFYTLAPNESGCRLWDGPMGPRGYPAMGMQGFDTRLVHRVVYMIEEGVTINSGTPVHHACGVRRCVEPTHLQAVTTEENTAEMLERRYYKKRIEILEEAIRRLDPSNPLIEELS